MSTEGKDLPKFEYADPLLSQKINILIDDTAYKLIKYKHPVKNKGYKR